MAFSFWVDVAPYIVLAWPFVLVVAIALCVAAARGDRMMARSCRPVSRPTSAPLVPLNMSRARRRQVAARRRSAVGR